MLHAHNVTRKKTCSNLLLELDFTFILSGRIFVLHIYDAVRMKLLNTQPNP